MAWQPQPANGTVADVLTITGMSWTAGDGAVAHDVYLGMNEMAVKMADTDSVLYQGQQAETTFAPADGLEPGQPYFWRIDEVDADGNVATGRVWGFTITDGIIVSDVTSTIDYDNTIDPFMTEVAFDVMQDWVQAGLADLSLEFMGALPVFVEDADGVITMSGGGDDIWNTTDQFRFAYAEIEGDVTIVAQVLDNGTGSNAWAKGGVMVRQSLDGDAVNVMGAITGGNGDGGTFQWRSEKGASSDSSRTLTGIAPPYWVRLTRVGNTFTVDMSADGVEWAQQGETPIDVNMVDPVLVGLAVTSHAAGETRAFQFSDVSVNGEPVSAADALAVADVGVAQGGNDPAPLYVAVEDAAGASAVVVHPDPAATNVTEWTEWRVALDDLAAAGIDLTAITAVAVGVGDGEPDGTGTVMVRNIQVVKPIADIVWVSDGYDDNGDEAPDDLAWVALLTAQGHNVDYQMPDPGLGDGFWKALDDDKLAMLDAADLVIVSRNSNSGDYDDGEEPTQWNSVETPLILMSTHIVRSSREKCRDTAGTHNATPTMQAADLTHPIFAGVNVDASGQLEAIDSRPSTFPGTAEAGNGAVLATRVDTGEIWIAAWDAGVEYYDGAAQTAGGPRMFFAGGTQETDEPNVGRGEYNLTAEGEKIFLNAVKMLLP
jgi:regulation of enolase protein 1 (concanavalin A-like superfamily)